MRGDDFFARVATRPPFTKLHPSVASFLKDYLSNEKVVRFGEKSVVNTSFPPYPSRAFDSLAGEFGLLGDGGISRLYSVTFAVTNRCPFNCWHCYNAGRSERDLPLDSIAHLAAELQDLGAVMVTLTGGEPLVRDDLEDICGLFDDRSCIVVGTTGDGLTADRARSLHERGVFAVGISLDSSSAEEHDRLRGRAGAFEAAIAALGTARDAGLYPYVVAVATRELLGRDRFMPFMRFAGDCGALEVHLLEPSAQGRLEGRTDVLLSSRERRLILDYQERVAADDTLPILSSYAYLEGADTFGCGAGLTHVYIDGSGEVCPCNLVPLSFGNVLDEPLGGILLRMRERFERPRTGCVGRLVASRLPDGPRPLPFEQSSRLCDEVLPRVHPVPRFFEVKAAAGGATAGRRGGAASSHASVVGQPELRSAYDKVHEDYDGFWLTQAAAPIEDLVRALEWRGDERVFEAGCGTGHATALLACRAGQVTAADLSEGMLEQARVRIAREKLANVDFIAGDALAILDEARRSGSNRQTCAQPETGSCFDVVFSSWVLGYIRLRPFFDAVGRTLAPGGRLAFVVHRENSPREPMDLFAEIVARDPSVLLKQVSFDFPRDAAHVAELLGEAGFTQVRLWEGAIVFPCARATDVLELLLKSGAGTAFHDAIDPRRREELTREFLRLLEERRAGRARFDVTHEYVACVATRS